MKLEDFTKIVDDKINNNKIHPTNWTSICKFFLTKQKWPYRLYPQTFKWFKINKTLSTSVQLTRVQTDPCKGYLSSLITRFQKLYLYALVLDKQCRGVSTYQITQSSTLKTLICNTRLSLILIHKLKMLKMEPTHKL